MKIIKSNVQENREQNYKKEEFMNGVLDQVFMIAKNDDNFQMSNEIESIENTIVSLKEKILNKNKLLKKSENLKKEFVGKLTNLENQNFRLKVNLLESLGSTDY